MHNGCICCALHKELLVEVARLAKEGRFDYLLIESTSISEPLWRGSSRSRTRAEGALAEWARLDTMVTVVEATCFLDGWQKEDELR